MRRDEKKNRYLMIFMMVGLGILIYFQFAAGSGAESSGDTANADNPGAPTDVRDHILRGKTNIVDFYSDYCPPCRRISPMLKKLDRKRDDIVVIKLDLNRPGVRGIDWNSPLARQYNIRSIPHFMIFNQNGELTHQGGSAMEQVGRLLQSEGIL